MSDCTGFLQISHTTDTVSSRPLQHAREPEPITFKRGGVRYPKRWYTQLSCVCVCVSCFQQESKTAQNAITALLAVF